MKQLETRRFSYKFFLSKTLCYSFLSSGRVLFVCVPFNLRHFHSHILINTPPPLSYTPFTHSLLHPAFTYSLLHPLHTPSYTLHTLPLTPFTHSLFHPSHTPSSTLYTLPLTLFTHSILHLSCTFS